MVPHRSHNEDEEMATKIKLCVDGYEAKKLSHVNKITKNDTSTVRFKFMEEVSELKYTQNKDLGRRLKATKGDIFECTLEKPWGCGYSIAQANEITKESVKENKMGKILVALRDTLND